MSQKTKDVLWRVLQAFIILIFCIPLIVFIVLNIVDFEDTGISYYLIMCNKKLVELVQKDGKILWYEYHWYYKFLLWIFMILLTGLGNFLFIKFLYKNNQVKKRDKVEVEKVEVEKKRNDLITKILEGKK